VAKNWYEPRFQRDGPVPYVPAGSMWIERQAFLELKGFDKTIETNEDCEFCGRARESGLRVLAFLDLGVVHLGTPQTLRQFYRKQRWHGTAVVSVFLRDIKKLSNAKTVLFSAYTLIGLLGIGLGALRVLCGGGVSVLVLAVTALLIPSMALAVLHARRQKNWRTCLQFAVLNLTFGFARAACLLDPRGWHGRKIGRFRTTKSQNQKSTSSRELIGQ
jgi:hypothetical protein